MSRKQKRLSDIEKLARTALEECQWLFDAIKAETMDQFEILPEFNRRLQRRGEAAVSYSSLNRYALKVRDGEVKRPSETIVSGQSIGPILAEDIRSAILERHGPNTVDVVEKALIALATK